MDTRGGNMTVIKYQNRSLILNILKNKGPIPRVDIAQLLKLTPAAITIIVNEMVKEGIIKELGPMEEDKRSGRKKVLIDINYDYKYVIGINIEQNHINIGISNIKGEILSNQRFKTDKNQDSEKMLSNIASECMNMLWKENILKDKIIGVGVGIVGPVDKNTGISKHAYGLWDNQVNVKKILEDKLGIRVVVDNNVRTLALGEIDYHHNEGMSNVLFIKYGPGIGAAIIIDNEIYYGGDNCSGEIGHTIVNIDGEECKCGKRGCLETIISQRVIKEKIEKIFCKENTPILFEICEGNIENMDDKNIYKALERRDKRITEIFNEAAFYMAIAITNAISLYDPNKVILYGEIFKYEKINKEFKAILSKSIGNKNIKDFVSISALTYKSNYIGGIALALREFFYSSGAL